MSRRQLRIHRTELDNLVSNLRGEVGEVVTSWLLLRDLLVQEHAMNRGDVQHKLTDQRLARISILEDRLEDDVVARLSELAESKIGRLNFYFVAEKLGKLHDEVRSFSDFIESKGFRQKRNQQISHKELPERFVDHRHLRVHYRDIVGGVAWALRLMKGVDRLMLGAASSFLWREMRKRRYEPMAPPSAGYLLLPYLRLSTEDRLSIVLEEHTEGRAEWSNIPTLINGIATQVKACKRWGVILLGDRLLALDEYPLIDLHKVEVSEKEGVFSRRPSPGEL